MENKKKKIKVGMIAAMPFPPQKACGIRVKNEISVIKKDVNVRLYCAPPGKRHEKADSYEIFRTEHVLDTTDYYKYYSWKKKLAVDFNLVRLIARDIRQGKIDVLHAHTGEGLFISFLAKIFAVKKIPVISDMHGPLLPELVHYKMIPNNFFAIALFSLFERILYNSATKILATSEGLGNYLKNKTYDKSKVEVVSDYVILSDFAKKKSGGKLLNKSKGNLIMYAGTLKDYQGVDDLIKAAKTVIKKFPKTTFGILGDKGLGKAYFEKMVSRLKLKKNFIFYGMVPHTEVRSYLEQADILVSPRKDNSITRGGFVSQMPEYMAMGKMIVATAVSDCDKMLTDGAGILVKPNSPASLAKGILLALKEKKNWPKYTKQAQKNARAFSWEDNSTRLVLAYRGVRTEKKRKLITNYYSVIARKKKAGFWENLYVKMFGVPALGKKLRIKIFQRMISQNKPQGNRALDIGCGLGEASIILAQKGYEVDSLDLETVSLGYLNEFKNKTDIRINIYQKDIENWQSHNKYDVVVALAVIDYLKNPQQIICRLAKKLNTGGTLIIGFPLKNRKRMLGFEKIANINVLHDFFDEKQIIKLLTPYGIKKIDSQKYLSFNMFYYMSFFTISLMKIGFSYEQAMAFCFPFFYMCATICDHLFPRFGTEIVCRFEKNES